MKVVDANGINSLIPKSTLCWILNEKKKLTNDRTRRYIFDSPKFKDVTHEDVPVHKSDVLSRGDYIILKECEQYLLGEILNFQFLNEDSKKGKRIPTKFCKLNDKNIGLLGSWCIVTTTGMLIPLAINELLNSSQYICHVNPKIFDISSKTISNKIIDFISEIENNQEVEDTEL